MELGWDLKIFCDGKRVELKLKREEFGKKIRGIWNGNKEFLLQLESILEEVEKHYIDRLNELIRKDLGMEMERTGMKLGREEICI